MFGVLLLTYCSLNLPEMLTITLALSLILTAEPYMIIQTQVVVFTC